MTAKVVLSALEIHCLGACSVVCLAIRNPCQFHSILRTGTPLLINLAKDVINIQFHFGGPKYSGTNALTIVAIRLPNIGPKRFILDIDTATLVGTTSIAFQDTLWKQIVGRGELAL
jgi:hypothetical protein